MTAPYWSNGVATLYQADARAIPLPDGSVHCCVTSPPYHGLRDYNLSEWVGGDTECSHALRPNATPNPNGTNTNWNHVNDVWPNGICGHCGATQQAAGIGLEPTLSDWLANIVAVSREVWRVLRDDGTYWLNLGDAYAGGIKGSGGKNSAKQNSNPGSFHDGLNRGKRTPRGEGSGRWGMGDVAVDGLPAKNLMGQPWRAAFALQDDGWILRSAIVWHKPNPMPESVSDRPTSAYEMVFLLTKRAHYFYDVNAIREKHQDPNRGHGEHESRTPHSGRLDDPQKEQAAFTVSKREYNPAGRNARNVWQIPTQGRPEAHFATYPDELPRRCILAGTSAHGVCADCGAPWARQTETNDPNGRLGSQYVEDRHLDLQKGARGVPSADGAPTRQTVGWQPTCDCNAADCPQHKPANKQDGHGPRHAGFNARWKESGGVQPKATDFQPTCTCDANRIPATVLDPFIGSGTTVAVAQQLGRHGIGLDLNPDYLAIAAKRLAGITLPMAI